MKKKLNIDAIRNELEGSVFFHQGEVHPTPPPSQPPIQPEPKPEQETTSSSQVQKSLSEDQVFIHSSDSVQASEKASIHASKHASMLSSDIDLEVIRKTLKLVGKEVLYVRLTSEEKDEVTDIEYTYQRQGIKTSGNEIGRIGVNFLLADYKANGEQSILAKLLAALHT